ncbi:MAG: sigma-70 family RNA polymerase sigma factor [Myxococcaceae bacterium]|nr:sigma-70 family RNA polymerase sigma factor [Myxococcaceae bacterium]
MTPPPSVEELYSQYGPMVLRRARAMLGDEQAARDATQEIFLKVFSAWAAFRADSSPVTWLYRATTNHCLNLLRNGARHSAALDLLGRTLVGHTLVGHTAGGHTSVGLDERLTLRAVLDRVPAPLREIAVYYYLDQLSHDEIAKLTGVSRRTVGNRLVEFHAAARDAAAELGVAAR